MASVSCDRMAAADAQLFWLSKVVPNDQFLLYVFDGTPDVGAAVAEVRRNAERLVGLQLRADDGHRWRYPRWRHRGIGSEQFVVHAGAHTRDWQDCLKSVVRLDQLDATVMTWRMHVFPPDVVVVQIVHALADGSGAAALAAGLLGRRKPIPAAARPDRGFLPARAVAAARAHRQLLRDTDAGLVAPPSPPRPLLSVNAPRSGSSVLRTIVVDRQRLRRPTVTVAALTAVSEALGGYLAARGEDIGMLGAEVPLATGTSTPAISHARNNFRNASVNLHPRLTLPQRAERIAAELAAQRRRSRHAAMLTSTAASAAVPAAVLRWGVRQFDPTARSATVAGHTVVSSVHRGPADLSFGSAPVCVTAGFPALSPMIGLTHGVHGIGETVAVSVHADPGVVDVEDYLDRLAHALDRRP